MSIYAFCILLPGLVCGILSLITSQCWYVCAASLNSADACWLHCMFPKIQTSEQRDSTKISVEIVAVHLNTLCYKQTVNAKCTALLSAALSHHMLELCLCECFLTCSFCFFMLPWIQREVNDFRFSIILCVYPSGMHQTMLVLVCFYQWTEAKLQWVNSSPSVTFSPCY